VPPSTPQLHPPQLTHTQSAPRLFQRTRTDQEQQHYAQAPQAPSHGQHAVLPSKFKPARMTSASSHKQSSFDPSSHTHAHSGQQQGDMGPPPAPLHARQKQSAKTMHTNQTNIPTLDSLEMHPVDGDPRIRHVIPPDQPPIFPQQSQRPTPSIVSSQRFVSSTRAPSRMAPFNMSGGNQRIPFVPGACGDFT
jgi:hypothetical protein